MSLPLNHEAIIKYKRIIADANNSSVKLTAEIESLEQRLSQAKKDRKESLRKAKNARAMINGIVRQIEISRKEEIRKEKHGKK